MLDGRAALDRPVPRSFYDRPVLRIARDVLGRVLVHDAPDGRVAGRVVEVEAYRGPLDPASHAYRGMTPRNRVMFGPPGYLYVYFTYGMHHCLNLVCAREGSAEAILIRALEPLIGIERMAARRGVSIPWRIARGPGCVAQALGLDLAHNGADLTRGPVWLADAPPRRLGLRIARGPRIGIRVGVDLPWRFYLDGHPCVSGGRPVRAPRRDAGPNVRPSRLGVARETGRGRTGRRARSGDVRDAIRR
jgi:DNA-3-methyladenine glycosylase